MMLWLPWKRESAHVKPGFTPEAPGILMPGCPCCGPTCKCKLAFPGYSAPSGGVLDGGTVQLPTTLRLEFTLSSGSCSILTGAGFDIPFSATSNAPNVLDNAAMRNLVCGSCFCEGQPTPPGWTADGCTYLHAGYTYSNYAPGLPDCTPIILALVNVCCNQSQPGALWLVGRVTVLFTDTVDGDVGLVCPTGSFTWSNASQLIASGSSDPVLLSATFPGATCPGGQPGTPCGCNFTGLTWTITE